jgi:hypothetical protein
VSVLLVEKPIQPGKENWNAVAFLHKLHLARAPDAG